MTDAKALLITVMFAVAVSNIEADGMIRMSCLILIARLSSRRPRAHKLKPWGRPHAACGRHHANGSPLQRPCETASSYSPTIGAEL